MKTTVDFPGRTRLLIEGGRARVLLTGSTLSQTVRLSTGLDNDSGRELAREIGTQQLAAAFAQTTAPASFDVSLDGSVLLKDLGFEILLHLDHQNVLVVGAPRFLPESSLMRAVRIIRIAVRALGWKPAGVLAPTHLHRMLSVALHPKVQIDQSNGVPLKNLRISGVEGSLVYAPAIEGFVLASKDLDEIRTVTSVLGEAFGGTGVRLVVVGARFEDAHTLLMDPKLANSLALTVVDKLHADTIHVSLNNDLMLDVRLHEVSGSNLTLSMDSVRVRSRSGKMIEGPLGALPQALSNTLQAASQALSGPVDYLCQETIVEFENPVWTDPGPQTSLVPARTLMSGDVIVAAGILGEREVQQVSAISRAEEVLLLVELSGSVSLTFGFEEQVHLVRRASDR